MFLLCILTFGSQDTSRQKTALSDAERSQETTKHQNDLARIFDPAYFGAAGEFKKLDGTCIEKESGEYVPLFASYLLTAELTTH